MKVLWSLLFVLPLLSESQLQEKQLPQESLYPFYSGEVVVKSSEILTDSTKLVLDTFGDPLFYFREIYTEVCETEVCFPVQLTLYWDFAGSFLGFSVPSEFPLTKAGHKKFRRVEYFQLYTLLNHPDSKLGKLNKKDLVKHNKTSENDPDAVTSETIHVSGETLVSGAAFTCFTLWNVVNKNDNLHSETFGMKVDFTGTGNLDDWENQIKNIQQISPAKFALLLKNADEQRFLRNFSVQQLLTENLDSLSPLKCLIINNYLNRQKYVYPETTEKLKQCKKIEDCFALMVSEVKIEGTP